MNREHGKINQRKRKESILCHEGNTRRNLRPRSFWRYSRGEQELGAIATENNLNPNMVRNWKAEFVENASSIFEEHGKAEREAKRKETAAAKERDKLLKTIGQLTVERNFLQDCFRAVGKPVPELDPEKQR